MNYKNEFEKYARQHNGISATALDQCSNNLTPMILEEREMRATHMSVFDRLMMDRIIYVQGEVNDTMSSIVSAQLMYLDNADTTIRGWRIINSGAAFY